MRTSLSLLCLLVLAACGSGGNVSHPDIADGLPVIANGFVNWTDVQTTPDGSIGIVNGTGNKIMSVVFTDAKGDDPFWPSIAPGATWASTETPKTGMYLVTAYGDDGRVFKRYGLYDPSIGWDAFVISNANWDVGF